MNLARVSRISDFLISEARSLSVAVVATGLATWSRFLLGPWLGDRCPFSLYYLSILATAWIAGTRYALVSVVLGTVAAVHFFVPPESSLHVSNFADRVQLAIYVIANCVAIQLLHNVRMKTAEAEMRSAENAKLSDSLLLANTQKDQFLALLAHELRNPLAPIHAAATTLAKSEGVENLHNIIKVIERNTEHLVRLTNDLLDTSRLERGLVEIRRERIDLCEAVRNAIEMTMENVRKKKHRLHCLTPEHPVWIQADSVRVAQLVGNLIDNAATYTPDGGRISVIMTLSENLVRLEVVDNGIGFIQSDAQKMLEPFVQNNTSRCRDYGGLGLGLSLVKRIAELHQAPFTLHSDGVGLGSRFVVEFELMHAPNPEEGLDEQLTQNCCDTITDSACTKVLLVDDNRDASQLLRDLLQLAGFVVQVAYDGFEALDVFSDFRPDLVVLDIGLPGIDGLEVARRLKLQRRHDQIRIVAVSGWSLDSLGDSSASLLFDEYLIKPVCFSQLLNIISTTKSGVHLDAPANSESLASTL